MTSDSESSEQMENCKKCGEEYEVEPWYNQKEMCDDCRNKKFTCEECEDECDRDDMYNDLICKYCEHLDGGAENLYDFEVDYWAEKYIKKCREFVRFKKSHGFG